MNISIFSNFIAVLKPIIEIAILWFVIYHIMFFFEGTRAVHVLRGIIILLIMFFFLSEIRF